MLLDVCLKNDSAIDYRIYSIPVAVFYDIYESRSFRQNNLI